MNLWSKMQETDGERPISLSCWQQCKDEPGSTLTFVGLWPWYEAEHIMWRIENNTRGSHPNENDNRQNFRHASGWVLTLYGS
jgi:hypothetical protein